MILMTGGDKIPADAWPEAEYCPQCDSGDTRYAMTTDPSTGERVTYQVCDKCGEEWDHT